VAGGDQGGVAVGLPSLDLALGGLSGAQDGGERSAGGGNERSADQREYKEGCIHTGSSVSVIIRQAAQGIQAVNLAGEISRPVRRGGSGVPGIELRGEASWRCRV
jgi:hypothetical protein